jgi:drug/metabolite transporter (DMT)-like permease
MTTVRGLPGEVLAILAAVAFSFKAILVKLALVEGVDPVALLAMRMLIAAPLFAALLLTLPGGEVRLTRRDAAAVLALGVVGFYLASLLDFLGLRYLTAGLERIVLYIHPTFVLLLGAAWTGKAPSARALVAVGVAWAGLVVAASADLAVGDPGGVLRGVALVLGCAVLYAVYLLGLDQLGPRLGTFRVAAMANLVAAVALGAHAAALHSDSVASASARVWGLAGLMAVGSTVVPAMLLTAAIRRIGPGRTSTLGMIGPFIATLLGWAALGEPLSAVQLVGGGVVVAGVGLAATERRAVVVPVGVAAK